MIISPFTNKYGKFVMWRFKIAQAINSTSYLARASLRVEYVFFKKKLNM